MSGEALVGKSVDVWWPMDVAWYSARVLAYSGEATDKHQLLYTDGQRETLKLARHRWPSV